MSAHHAIDRDTVHAPARAGASGRPLRIGLLMHSLHPRGGVVHTLELADALTDRGHDVTVFTAARDGERLFRQTSARLSIASLGGLPADLVGRVDARMSAMHRHLRQWPGLAGIDILHSQDSISANALARLQAEGGIKGYVRTVHHLDVFDDAQLSGWQARGVRDAARVLCVSALWQQVLHKEWGIDAAHVCNGVNLQRFQTRVTAARAQADADLCKSVGVQSQGPVWLAVGGVEARKNTVRLLQAFIQARRHCEQAQLVIAGGASLLDHDEERKAFQAICHAHGLAAGQAHADRVIVTGPLPDEALPALYRRASAVAMPSMKEGFGLVVLEALACGTPAIASRIAPFTEHLRANDVLWVDPFDVEDIARALLRSLDESEVETILANAPEVCARMSWRRSAIQHEALYQRSMSHHHA